MIIDSITGFERYISMHPGFAKAFTFLRSGKLESLVEGRHEIDGDNVFVIISEENGKDADDVKLETHDSYIDIQVLLAGSETMGWKDRACCQTESTKYDEPNDIAYYDDEPEVFFMLEPMNVVVFFPHDAHAPMIGNDLIRKAVVKVKV